MAQENRKLLLIDLSARLLYGVKINVNGEEDTLLELGVDTGWVNASYDIDDVKPYLRPMSNMTEEEKTELFQLMGNGTDIQRIDFYLSHYFDFRCLIPMGLALEAPEGMY